MRKGNSQRGKKYKAPKPDLYKYEAKRRTLKFQNQLLERQG